MQLTVLASAILALAQGALAIPAKAPALDVTLSQIDNTRVKAVVKNTGAEEVTFVHLNFFRDAAPVKKVSLFRNATEVPFNGIKLRFRNKGLTDDVLTTLAAGATFEDEFDIASTADLTEGGVVTVRSQGVVPLTKDNKVSGYIPFTSNEIELEVDGAKAAAVPAAINLLDRRTKVASCSGSRATALQTALRNTVSLANAAASAAESGSSSRFSEYFKTTSSATRSTVAARLRAVAREAGSTSSGKTTYYCGDPYGYCDPNVLAYTLPSKNIVANCDIYYSDLPALARSCHAQDQATTTLHEFTHAPGVYSPGTDDLGYGYQAATALSTSDALNNADTYALFANAVNLNC
ncbi:putative penicillolysin/deuterolysin metalloprotease [Aspergillus clavatus NRRL 1]|uniref:Neutral protease 2 homolog ACLA_052720 n=1 Tax=Aspergillus clavatus (strain ATCC 1007 / CBS 513.65 / DSM 816 / NCTC 3887 / NRRL 1 / QM 1276 / 107) TaxID=344612 RepID=NPIIA_ASPCL|nr:deuterolysin metalloprotease (M35) family protein [Aspergillus clavatus NRRL 1]A1CIU4.1 RecName: Full=Neutral protease 2 homolog ACLA_052720; AltName: Full=Deuterolysin ACLA_052720; Flags: Precursor [Aspergillus clavatus NRRL 1]EAW10799.1 deuterolysin metalloprotease (M35) family protein [Aspergillus clavatus NRRL 1]